MSIEAMKQALEALALFASDESDEGQIAIAAHEALRQAIEQAEKQEPVAWMASDNRDIVYANEFDGGGRFDAPLYTAPPQREWVSLTDAEITELWCDYDASQFQGFVRTIEAKLKEKNHVD